MEKELSIIIPTLNEADNLKALISRIHTVLTGHSITYEVIIVDDYSTDTTKSVIAELFQKYPISFFVKEGKKGKAYSLLQGFAKAKYSVLAFMDADLQYPPEALPEMLQKIHAGADVVNTKRNEQDLPIIRKIVSKTFAAVFGRFLHGLPFDVQSGMKMFRKKVIRRYQVNPSPWTFDLEFLLKARHAGYTIVSVPIRFAKRHAGKTKVNLLLTTWEIGMSAIKMKFKDFGVIPFLPEDEARNGKGFTYNAKRFVSHTDLPIEQSAFKQVNAKQLVFMVGSFVIIGGLLLANFKSTAIIMLGCLTVLYFTDLLFNLYVILRSFIKKPEIQISASEIAQVPDTAWPTYTIFCPLYKEWTVVPQFVTAIGKLSYPKEKLQVVLLLEADDEETIRHVKAFDLPSFFEIRIIPDSLPKTKPKALNFGLLHATGEYIVVYDAEDVPDSDQLKKAVLGFQKVKPNTICVQAKLNFYNPHQNILTRAFTAEYSLWFDLVLTGLQSINAPIPLGGTSNHFKKSDLETMKGWDPFNVTEDCDLGVRLSKQGYRTAIIDSVTLEEANSDLLNWFNQRTRWIKGYIQTYLVHMRDVRLFFHGPNKFHIVTFQLVVGGKIASMFINPFMWLITISYFALRSVIGPTIESFFPSSILYLAIFSLVFGNFLYLFYYMIGCVKKEYYNLVKFAFLVPVYWLVMSAAAWMALYMIIVKPHHWAKTKHGLHLQSAKGKDESREAIGDEISDAKIVSPFPRPSLSFANI